MKYKDHEKNNLSIRKILILILVFSHQSKKKTKKMPKQNGFTVIEKTEAGNVTDRSQTPSPTTDKTQENEATPTISYDKNISHAVPEMIITPPPLPPREDEQQQYYFNEMDLSQKNCRTSQSPILFNPFYKSGKNRIASRPDGQKTDIYTGIDRNNRNDMIYINSHSKDVTDSETDITESGCKMEFVNFLDLADFVSDMNIRLAALEHKLAKQQTELDGYQKEKEQRRNISLKKRIISCFSWLPCVSNSRK